MGGAASTARVFYAFLRYNSRGVVAATGPAALATGVTIRYAVVWNFGLLIAWVWALPFALGGLRAAWTRAHSLSLAGAFAPAFLFHALVHVGDPDHTLVTIPALCVVGGATLAALRPRAAMLAAATAAALISAWNFRTPFFRDLSGAWRGAIKYRNDWNRSTFRALGDLQPGPGTAIVWDDSLVSWRQVYYYFPSTRLLNLQEQPPAWIFPGRAEPAGLREGAIPVAGVTALVLGVSYQQANALAAWPGAERRGPLVWLPWKPGAEVRVGGRLLRGVSD
jgi:hypothetical protein